MFGDGLTPDEILNKYRDDVNKLASYLNWLEQKSGTPVTSIYGDDGLSENSVAVPVYDSNLMNFVRTADKTAFMDRNYRYAYTRNHLKDAGDEIAFIDNATILQMDVLGGILSHYILGGRTKGRLWSEGMNNGVFLHLVRKMKELTDFWANAERKSF